MGALRQKLILLVGTNLCCLLALQCGLRELERAQAYASQYSPPEILIEAVHYDAYGYDDAGEAIALRNSGPDAVDIGGWTLSDIQHTTVEIPEGTTLQPHTTFWLTDDNAAFQKFFGRQPDLELQHWPGFANSGDEVQLRDERLTEIDTVVFGNGEELTNGWIGSAIQPYVVSGVFSREGQILYRKKDPTSGDLLPDSNQAIDWAQDSSDPILGRRVYYPGWESEKFFFPVRSQAASTLTISITPDNGYETIANTIEDARSSVWVNSFTIDHLALGQQLAAAAGRGVSVTLLLEGDPVGGISDYEKDSCQRIESSGGQCWFMISDQDRRIQDRFRYLHAKYLIIDNRLAIVSSENLSPNSLPNDAKNDGTWGRRGVILMTSNPEIVDAMLAVFRDDFDPDRHNDLFRWRAEHPKYGAPSLAYVPIQNSGGTTYTIRFPQAVSFEDVTAIEVQQAPDNLIRTEDGILGVINQASRGDTLLIQQLQERPHWGITTSNRTADPNIRLEMIINAARRGAAVRLLLDSFFDLKNSPVSNAITCDLLNTLALKEKLRLACIRGNPTGLGIHNKMILAHIGGRGYAHVGSWNGTELSSKGNREIVWTVQSDLAYAYLADMFERDWPHIVFLPLTFGQYAGYGDHILISEILYDSAGQDEAEFVELVNPTRSSKDLSDYAISDAVNRDDFEDARRFPENTILAPNQVIVVATSAAMFYDAFSLWPDFEILDSSHLVTNMIDDPSWGDPEAFLQLGNQGDEVLLRNREDEIVDAVTYGESHLPGHVACPPVTGANYSLERYPYWLDTNNCQTDFREWPFPSPGKVR